LIESVPDGIYSVNVVSGTFQSGSKIGKSNGRQRVLKGRPYWKGVRRPD
jgi:hypothetical protein